MSVRPATAAEKRHMGRVSALPCACCGQSAPSAVHHIRSGQGMAQRAAHWLTIPLCQSCHQGPNGIHGDRSLLRVMKMDEIELLANTIRQLVGV